MTKVCDVIEVMEKWAPSALAEPWDNVGLITGSPDDHLESLIVSLDVTEKAIEQALEHRLSMIISHHPPIFKPLKTLAGKDRSSEVIRKVVKEDIACYSAHTNLDQAPDGVSAALAEKLELIHLQRHEPKPLEPDEKPNYCR